MLRLSAMLLLCLFTIGHALAEGKLAGKFDYYVLSLSWSPSWCALTGDARNSPQCDSAKDHGFTLHGLWPQNEKGWPSFCQTAERAPNRKMTAAMADIMGTPGLAWHQWDKHGRCSGLSADQYYTRSRQAYDSINRPEVFRKLMKPLSFPATIVEEAFVNANDGLARDMVSVTCKGGHFQEVRICLSKDLKPRKCGTDTIRDCSKRVIFPPIR